MIIGVEIVVGAGILSSVVVSIGTEDTQYAFSLLLFALCIPLGYVATTSLSLEGAYNDF